MSNVAKIDAIKNQYPHLSDQEIADMLGRSKPDNLRNMYPHLSDEEIAALCEPKENKVVEKLNNRLAALEKGRQTQAAKRAAAAKTQPKKN